MTKTRKAPQKKGQGGMALIEMVMATVLTASLVGGVVLAGKMPILANKVAANVAAIDESTAARMRFNADLTSSVQDSLRTVLTADGRLLLELRPQLGRGRFLRAPHAGDQPPCPGGDRLDLGTPDSCFVTEPGQNKVGGVNPGALVYVAGGGQDAFYSAGGTAVITSISHDSGSRQARIGITQIAPFPDSGDVDSVFQIAGEPITWECDPAKKTLTRFTGYAASVAQPESFPGANPDVYNLGVSACTFAPGVDTRMDRQTLLLDFDRGLVDASPSHRSLTATGAVAASATGWTGAGGSFSGGRLAVPASPALEPGARDFSIDFRLKSAATPAADEIVATYETAATGVAPWAFVRGSDGRLRFYAASAAGGWDVADAVDLGPVSNVWTHFAAARAGGSLLLFREGNVVATLPVSGALAAGDDGLSVGAGTDGRLPFHGDVDEFRVLNGVSAWRTPFTPQFKAYRATTRAFVGNAATTGVPVFSVAAEPRNGRN